MIKLPARSKPPVWNIKQAMTAGKESFDVFRPNRTSGVERGVLFDRRRFPGAIYMTHLRDPRSHVLSMYKECRYVRGAGCVPLSEVMIMAGLATGCVRHARSQRITAACKPVHRMSIIVHVTCDAVHTKCVRLLHLLYVPALILSAQTWVGYGICTLNRYNRWGLKVWHEAAVQGKPWTQGTQVEGLESFVSYYQTKPSEWLNCYESVARCVRDRLYLFSFSYLSIRRGLNPLPLAITMVTL